MKFFTIFFLLLALSNPAYSMKESSPTVVTGSSTPLSERPSTSLGASSRSSTTKEKSKSYYEESSSYKSSKTPDRISSGPYLVATKDEEYTSEPDIKRDQSRINNLTLYGPFVNPVIDSIEQAAQSNAKATKQSPTELIKVEDGVYASPKDPATVGYPTYTFSPTTQEKTEESSPATVVPDVQTQPSSPTYTLPPINHEKNLQKMADAWHNPSWQQRGHTWGEAARKNEQRRQMHEEGLRYQAETISLLSQSHIKDQVDRKTAQIKTELEKALTIGDAYLKKTTETDAHVLAQRFALFELEIPDAFFNKLWMETQYEITKIICDKKGRITWVQPEHRKQIEAIVNNFEEQISRSWQDYQGSLAREVASGNSSKPHISSETSAWLDKVRNNPDNKKFFHINNLVSHGNFKQAETLVRDYIHAGLAEREKRGSISDETIEKNIVALQLYQRYFDAFYDEYGVDRRFSNHPAYKAFTQHAQKLDPREVLVARDDLNALFEHVTFIENHLNSYQSDKVIDKELYEARKQALRTYYQEGDARRVTTVNLSEIGKQYLADHGVYPPKFLTMEANALQRQAQQEFKNITEKAAVLDKSGNKNIAPLLQLNAHLLEVGVEYTLGQNIAQAQVIADCCNTILDNKEAIAEGAVKGVVSIGQYMYEHPVETAMTIYAPGVMLPYRATKMTLEALGYTYNRLSRVDYKTLTTQKVFDKFEKIYKDFEELPTSIKFREGTALGVQILLDGKITDGVSKGARAVLKKASESISKIQHPAVVGVLAAASKAQQKVPVRNDHLAHMNENHSVQQQKPQPNNIEKTTESLLKESNSIKDIHHPVVTSQRVGSALKKDAHHMFNDIIDNYARYAKEFNLVDNDVTNKGYTKKLYQIEGSLDGNNGIFEWIVEYRNTDLPVVSHRMFIKNGKIAGIPNLFEKKK